MAQPAANTQSINRWEDTPKLTSPAEYEISQEHGETRVENLAKGNRRILEALMLCPIYCASRVRISDRVLILKRDYGVAIRTDMYTSDGTSECERFGVYTLDCQVRRLDLEVAA